MPLNGGFGRINLDPLGHGIRMEKVGDDWVFWHDL